MLSPKKFFLHIFGRSDQPNNDSYKSVDAIIGPAIIHTYLINITMLISCLWTFWSAQKFYIHLDVLMNLTTIRTFLWTFWSAQSFFLHTFGRSDQPNNASYKSVDAMIGPAVIHTYLINIKMLRTCLCTFWSAQKFFLHTFGRSDQPNNASYKSVDAMIGPAIIHTYLINIKMLRTCLCTFWSAQKFFLYTFGHSDLHNNTSYISLDVLISKAVLFTRLWIS
jgi:hypothetical protein